MESMYEEWVGVVAGGVDDDLVEKSVFQAAAHAHVCPWLCILCMYISQDTREILTRIWLTDH